MTGKGIWRWEIQYELRPNQPRSGGMKLAQGVSPGYEWNKI